MNLPMLISETEKVVSTVEEFTQTVASIEEIAGERGQMVCWRGQANREWPLMSSLIRAISSSVPPENSIIEALEKKILAEASSWITEFDVNGLQQHSETLQQLRRGVIIA